MAQDEVPGGLGGHAAADGLVGRFAHHHETRGEHGLRQHRLENGHLLDGAAVRPHDGLVDGARDVLAEDVGVVRPLRETADDVLLGVFAAEEVALRLGLGLVAEDRRMAGMGDEVGERVVLGQVAGVGCSDIEHHHHRAGAQRRGDLVCNLADAIVGDGEDDDVGGFESGVELDGLEALALERPRGPGR